MKALERLRRGEPVFGLAQTYPVAAYSELAAWSGYDFLLVDCEHGVADETAQLEIFRALAGTDAFALVRIRPGDESAVARYLDFGAEGIMVPDVRTPAQARQISFAATGRWTGGLRGDRYGAAPGSAGQKAFVLVLIESPEGVANIEAILDHDGIDAVMIGSGDLSTNLGTPGKFDTPDYQAAVEAVEQAARARGKILGAKPDAFAPLPTLMERGYRLFMIGRDTIMFRKALVDTLEAARAAARPNGG